MQLIYEVRSGAGTIQLLTLKPEELNEEITKKFEVLGIEIPDMKYVSQQNYLKKRTYTDLYLPWELYGVNADPSKSVFELVLLYMLHIICCRLGIIRRCRCHCTV